MARVLIFIMIAFFASSENGEAHPMGNFSINHYSGIEIEPGKIRVHYILDLAEIPAFQEIQEIDTDRDGLVSSAESEAYLSKKIPILTGGLVLKVGENLLSLLPLSHELTFPPGAGGLPTLRLSILYQAESPFLKMARDETQPVEVFFRDNNYPNRLGWKEIAASGSAGIGLIGSPLPTVGGELRSYPEGAIKSPPEVLEARFGFKLGPVEDKPSGPKGLSTGGQGILRNDRFTALMTDGAPKGPMILLSLLIAFGLGTFHALSPGHGKTIVAAYLVGSRGTGWSAVLLGGVVTLSHTVGVFILGLATLYLSKFIVPERLYPWLGLLSGIAILIIGLSLFLKRWRSMRTGSGHDHDHSHSHPHHRDADHHSHSDGHLHEKKSFSGLLGLGVTGGIIPCPSALVVLLSAIAFHQVGLGLLLIVAFSAGLASTLVGIGLLMVYLGGMMNRLERFSGLSRILPIMSAGVVAILGGVIAWSAWVQ